MIRKRSYATGLGPKAKQDSRDMNCESALRYVESRFPPLAKFDSAFPFVALKHQIYALIDDRTRVDRELEELSQSDKIRMFKMNTAPNEYAIVWMDHLEAHIQQAIGKEYQPLVGKFVKDVIKCYADVAVDKKHLCRKLGFPEKDVRSFISMGLLTVRDVGSYWISLPGIGAFVKMLTNGRQAVLRTIKSSKYKEIMREELEERKIGACKLGMAFHVLDIVGGDFVERVPTTTGTLLRIEAPHKTSV